MHLALATAFPRDARGVRQQRRTAAAMTERLDAAVHCVPALRPYAPGLRTAFDALAELDAGPRRPQRVHGDLHLGQVLRRPAGGTGS